jgi:hypothetical protein
VGLASLGCFVERICRLFRTLVGSRAGETRLLGLTRREVMSSRLHSHMSLHLNVYARDTFQLDRINQHLNTLNESFHKPG